ncbi:MAG TPA: YceD family protein [Gallionella sp.]|nr:YceD family protein [Gallionella sp.]
MSARPFIDSLDFAGNGKEINGEVPFAGMPRLLDELENPEGVLQYTVRGGVDKQGVSFLDVSMTGDCRLRCQRCLGALEHPIRIATRLLLRDQAELDALDDDEEEFDSVLAETQLDVLDLLEEEILLSLPISPRHESGECQAKDGDSAGNGKKNPFAALANLKVVK